MDSLTHIVLGSCIGELYAGKSLGKKALIVGAVAQSLPDIDVVASLWLSPAADLLVHRGITHSFLFILLITYPFAWAVSKWRWLPPMPLSTWAGFILLELFVHLFLDAFNAYGTAWFAPFSQYRVAFHSLFVADPLFTIPLVLVSIFLVFLPSEHRVRKKIAKTAIVISTLYISLSLINKQIINTSVTQNLTHQQISYQRYFTTPTPGNILLWYIVVEVDQGFFIGYRSIFDTQDNIPFQYFPRNESLLNEIFDEDLKYLKRFSEGYYTISSYKGNLVFNDLRFGQMMGWDNPKAPFVFYYFLNQEKINEKLTNELLIQRGRFENWDFDSVVSFFKKIKKTG